MSWKEFIDKVIDLLLPMLVRWLAATAIPWLGTILSLPIIGWFAGLGISWLGSLLARLIKRGIARGIIRADVNDQVDDVYEAIDDYQNATPQEKDNAKERLDAARRKLFDLN